MQEKRCTICGKLKKVYEFHKSLRDGYKSQCKECRKIERKKIKKEKSCLICGSLFLQKNSISKYCSNECASKAYKKNRIKIRVCKNCGIEYKSFKTIQNYCSRKCFHEHSKITRLENNNPSYRNGYYTIKSKSSKTHERERCFNKNAKELKEKMYNDYGYYFCEYCKTSNFSRLETHHLIYRSEKPNHINLHDKINLIILCIKCHNEFHKHKYLRNDIVVERKLNKLFGNDILNK